MMMPTTTVLAFVDHFFHSLFYLVSSHWTLGCYSMTFLLVYHRWMFLVEMWSVDWTLVGMYDLWTNVDCPVFVQIFDDDVRPNDGTTVVDIDHFAAGIGTTTFRICADHFLHRYEVELVLFVTTIRI